MSGTRRRGEREFSDAASRRVVTDGGETWRIRQITSGRWVKVAVANHGGWRDGRPLRMVSPVREVDDGFGVLVTVRFCAQCRGWLPQRAPFFSIHSRDPVTRRAVKWDSWCAQCRSEKTKSYLAKIPREEWRLRLRERDMRIREDPVRLERLRATKRKSDARRSKDPELRRRRRDARRRRYRERMADPARHAEYLEIKRIEYRIRQERNGRTVTRNFRNAANAFREDTGAGSGGYAVEPLALWLDVVLAREVPDFGVSHGRTDRDNRSRTLVDLAYELDVPARRLWAVHHREQQNVSFTTADKMLTNYGKPVEIDGATAAGSLEARCREMPGNGERLLRYIDMAERIAHLDGAVIVRAADLYPA